MYATREADLAWHRQWEAEHRTERNAANAARKARRRQEWIVAHGPCAECGSWDELEVDHVDAGTKVSSNVWSWSQIRRDAELAKCQVLCHDCHKTKTYRNLEHAHGERSNLARWSETEVRKVRRLFESGIRQCDIAEEMHMSRGTVWNIVHGKAWNHCD